MTRRKEKKGEKSEKNRKSMSKERKNSKDRKGKTLKERKLSKERKTKDDIKMSKLREKYKDLESLGESAFDGTPRSLLDATWNRLSDMEENLHVVLDVREDLMEQVMKECQERYMAKQAIKFHVHCAYRAFMDLFGTLYLARDPGPEAPWTKRLRPLEAPPPQPNLGDSWATGVLRRAPQPPHGKTEERLLGPFGIVDIPTYEGSRGPPTPPLLQPFDETLIRHEEDGGVAKEPPAPPPSMILLPETRVEGAPEEESEPGERRRKRSQQRHKRPRQKLPVLGPTLMSAAAAAASVVSAPRRAGSSLLAIEETLRSSRISVSRLPGDRVPVFALLKEQKRRSSQEQGEADPQKGRSITDPTGARRELGGRLSATGFGLPSKGAMKPRGVRHVRYRRPPKPCHEVAPPPTPTGPQPFRAPSPDFQVAPPRPLPRRPAPPAPFQDVRRVTPVGVPATPAMEQSPGQDIEEKKTIPQKKIDELSASSSSSTGAPTDYDAYKSDPRTVKKHKDDPSSDKTKRPPSRDISDTRLFRRPSDRRTQRAEERAAQLDVDVTSGGSEVQLPPAARFPPRRSGARPRGRLTYGARPTLGPQQQQQQQQQTMPRDSSQPRTISGREAARSAIENVLSKMGRSTASDPRDFRRLPPEEAPVPPAAKGVARPTQPQKRPSPDVGSLQGGEKPGTSSDRKPLVRPSGDQRRASEDVDLPRAKQGGSEDVNEIRLHSDSSGSSDFTSAPKGKSVKDSTERPKDTQEPKTSPDTQRLTRSSKEPWGSGDSKGGKDSGEKRRSEDRRVSISEEDPLLKERPHSSERPSRRTKDSGEERPPMTKAQPPEQRGQPSGPSRDKSPVGPVRLSYTPTPRDKVSPSALREVEDAAADAVDAALIAATDLLVKRSLNMRRGQGQAAIDARDILKEALDAATDAKTYASKLPVSRPTAEQGGKIRRPGSGSTSPRESDLPPSESLFPPGFPLRRKPTRRRGRHDDEDPCLRCPRIEEMQECPEKHEEDVLCECSDDNADVQQQDRPVAPQPREDSKEKKPSDPRYHHHKHHHRKERGEISPLLTSSSGPSKGPRGVTASPELPEDAVIQNPLLSRSTPTGNPAKYPPTKTGKEDDVRREVAPLSYTAKAVSDLKEAPGRVGTVKKTEPLAKGDTPSKNESPELKAIPEKDETTSASLHPDNTQEQGDNAKSKTTGKTLTPVKSASPENKSPKSAAQTIFKELMR